MPRYPCASIVLACLVLPQLSSVDDIAATLERQTEELLRAIVGRYALSPAMTCDISISDGHLEGQETGHAPERLLAEAPAVLFVPRQPALSQTAAARTRRPHNRVRGTARSLGPGLGAAAVTAPAMPRYPFFSRTSSRNARAA